MHIVYFHPDKKNGYGATTIGRWPKRLEEQKLDVSKGRIVEQGLTLEEASDRERELQLRDGYPPDDCTYEGLWRGFLNPYAKAKAAKSRSKTLKGRPIPHLHTKEVRQRALANIDRVAWGKKISKIQKGLPTPWFQTPEARKKRAEANQRPLIAIKDGKKQYFKSGKEASRVLGCKPGAISSVLSGRYKTSLGYKFEYA